jgi:hypothetical protein
VLVEVKNTGEHYYIRGKPMLFAKLLNLAIQNDMQPMLMASHLSASAIKFCERIGIAAYAFGRQFVDGEIKAEVKDRYSGIWKTRFQFVNLKHVFANPRYLDPRTVYDLDTLRDPVWIETAHAQWSKMRRWIPQITEALAKGDLYAVNVLLDAHA